MKKCAEYLVETKSNASAGHAFFPFLSLIVTSPPVTGKWLNVLMANCISFFFSFLFIEKEL